MSNSIYIHFPFCTTKCGYCSFYSETYSHKRVLSYFKKLKEDIKDNKLDVNYAKTIYFGGGTPSLLSPEMLQEIISMIPHDKKSEITLECNPITLTDCYLEELSKTEVNRLSLGIQSMIEEELELLERRHTPEQIVSLISKLRVKGYTNISGDLMYGLKGQSINRLRRNIDKYMKLNLDHISIYALSIDSSCRFYREGCKVSCDDIVADMYSIICQELADYGFIQYEISNFSSGIGNESAHNLSYWNQENYYGLGAGAVGALYDCDYIKAKRITNEPLDDWLNNAKARVEYLSKKELEEEYIMLQLRLNRGLDNTLLQNRYGYNIIEAKKAILDKYSNQGYLRISENVISLTNKSRFISNYIISDLLED